MSNGAMLPDNDTARQVIIQAVHKQAFLGRMAELGHEAASEAEADAMVGLGFKVAAAAADPMLNKQAEMAQAPGPYAFASEALDRFLGTSKQASAHNPHGLDNVAMAGALELARDPTIFASALVLKHAQDAALAAAQAENEDEEQKPVQ